VSGETGHLDLARIIMYVDPALSTKDRAPLAEHIKNCRVCSEKVISLLTLRSSFAMTPEEVKSLELTPDCVPLDLLSDFLGGRLAGMEMEKYSSHLDDCDLCFERAAYFSHSSVKMTEGVLRIERTPIKFLEAVAPGLSPSSSRQMVIAARQSLGRRIAEWIASPIPAYAFAATLLFFLAFGGGKPSVVDLGAHKTFSIYEPPTAPGPSFGFSDAGRKVGEADAGLAVSVKGGIVNFQWNAVQGVDEYRLIITEMDLAGPREVYNSKTAEPGATMDINSFGQGRAYRWSVNGVRPDKNIFTATGQFAIHKP